MSSFITQKECKNLQKDLEIFAVVMTNGDIRMCRSVMVTVAAAGLK
jgi:hypothetical protein